MHLDPPRPLVSVVVPVLRDTSELGGLLDSLPVDRFDAGVEVVVVNGDAADRSLDPLRRRATTVQWLDSEAGAGAAR